MSDDQFDYRKFRGHVNVRYRKHAPSNLPELMASLKRALCGEDCLCVDAGDPVRRIACVIRKVQCEWSVSPDLLNAFLRDISAVAEQHGCYLSGEIVYNDEYNSIASVGYIACSRRGGIVCRSMIDRRNELERENAALKAEMAAVLGLHATTPGKLRAICTTINALRTCASALQVGFTDPEIEAEPPLKKRKSQWAF